MLPYNNQGYFPYPQTFSYEQPETIYYQGRAFVRIQSIMPNSMWIEKGSDGRGYYVKKKPAVPSLRQKFAEAFHDFRQRNQQVNTTVSSQPSTTASRADTTAQGSNSRKQSKSQSEMANQSKDVAKSNQNTHAYTPHMAYYGYPQMPGYNPYQHWQYSGAYNPALMLNPYALHQQQFPGIINPFTQNSALSTMRPSLASPPPTTTPVQAPAVSAPQLDMTSVKQQNAGSLAISQMAMNPDGLKFKCMICGRFRSTHYHVKHRLAPGQLPGPTICRRCRKHTTESEDETSDSEEDDLLYRSRAAARNRSRSRLSRAASRARSSSRMAKRRDDFDYYAVHNAEDSSSESEEWPPRSSKSRSRKGRNVRYDDEPYPVKRSKSKTKKVIYMQEPSVQSEASEDEVEVRYIKQAPENTVVRSRPGTPASPGLLKHLSHKLSQPVYVEQRVYYDEPPASLSGKSIPPLSTNNPYRNIPVSQAEQYMQPPGYAPEQYIPQNTASAGFPHSQAPPPRNDQGRFGYKNGPSVPYAPTPPEAFRQCSRAPSRGAERSFGSAEQVRMDRARSRSRSRGRRRSSERSFSEQEAALADDYDWYDADGMKVRVREI